MKRIIMMLALAAFLVAALSVSALSAFANADCSAPQHADHPNCSDPVILGANDKPLKEQQIQTVGENNKNVKKTPPVFTKGHD